ncbi:MAG: ribosome maturation factor RimP [SAR324 cluster bacterium]
MTAEPGTRDAHNPLDLQVEALLAEPVAGLGVRLLEARLVQEGRWILRLVIDRPPSERKREEPAAQGAGQPDSAVTLDDCARVSELAGRILDVEDPIPHAFRLEVSSPGVFRPLKERRHFEQSVGKWVRLTLAPDVLPERKDRTFRALLAAVEGETLRLQAQGEPVTVPLQAVRKARLDPEL